MFFKEQAEALSKYGHDVSVIYIHLYSILEIIKDKKLVLKNSTFIEKGVETYKVEYPSIPKLHTLKDKLFFYLFKKKFAQYIEKNGLPDIVHVHSFMVGRFALWVKETYNIPYVVTEHFTGFAREILSKPDIQLAQKVFNNSHKNIAVSNQFKKLLEDKFDVEFQYIPNIVNINFFNPIQQNNSGPFQFINIAFLDKKKNQSMLIKAFAQVFSNRNVTLTIVGDGPEYDALKRLIEKLQMQKQIFLYGRASREEVKKLLQQSDAFVLSSQYETFGVVVIEAMACGLPVVATKCGGPESIVQDDKVGLLSEIDVLALAESMSLLYEHQDDYNAEYIAGYVKEYFSEKVVVKQLYEVYQSVLNSDREQRK